MKKRTETIVKRATDLAISKGRQVSTSHTKKGPKIWRPTDDEWVEIICTLISSKYLPVAKLLLDKNNQPQEEDFILKFLSDENSESVGHFYLILLGVNGMLKYRKQSVRMKRYGSTNKYCFFKK